MKLLFYLFLTAIIAVACNNGKAGKQPTVDDNIAAGKIDTTKMANFPGTAVYIQLPKGFEWNETAMGFYKEEDGSNIKYDHLKKMQYAANMPVEETMGLLINQQPLTIDGHKGGVKTYQDGRTFTRLSLVFGDSTFAEFIEASYFSHREQTGKDIMVALNSLVCKK